MFLQLDLPFHKIKKISDLKRLEGLIDRRLEHEGVAFGDRQQQGGNAQPKRG